MRREGFLAAFPRCPKSQLARALGRVPWGAQHEGDDAGPSRGPVPWAGDAPPVTASRSLGATGAVGAAPPPLPPPGSGGLAPSGFIIT